MSLVNGLFPDVFKTARIVPIFKKGENTNVQNYHPVAILSSISKVLEKVIYSRIMQYLDSNKTLVNNQHGFRKTKSTIYK